MARLPPAAVPRHLTPRYVRLTAQPWPARHSVSVMQPHVRQTEQGPPASRKPRSQLRPDNQARHAGPVSGVPHFDVDPPEGAELGDRRQDDQQTSMIASHAESAGSLRSEAADTLRYDRWPRLSREIRLICVAISPHRIAVDPVPEWEFCVLALPVPGNQATYADPGSSTCQQAACGDWRRPPLRLGRGRPGRARHLTGTAHRGQLGVRRGYRCG
jgi:hypothetical protein